VRLPALLLLMVVSGCTTVRGTAYARPSWKGTAPFGKVAVLVPCCDVLGDDAAKALEIKSEVEHAIGALPGAEIVDARSIMAALGHEDLKTPLSDFEVVVAARKTGDVEKVAVVTVGSYHGSLALFLPPVPLWAMETTVLYSMRVVDVQSGKLLFLALRHVQRGGPFAIVGRSDLPADLATDLAKLLNG
jgi:hypothetical protein